MSRPRFFLHTVLSTWQGGTGWNFSLQKLFDMPQTTHSLHHEVNCERMYIYTCVQMSLAHLTPLPQRIWLVWQTHGGSSTDPLTVVVGGVGPPVGLRLDIAEDHVLNGDGEAWHLQREGASLFNFSFNSSHHGMQELCVT